MGTLHVGAAFAAGVLSFVSPCCLPLYPSFISYITGMSINTLKTGLNQRSVRLRVLLHTVLFIAGFSAVFYSLGYGAGMLGFLFHSNREWIRKIAGLVMIVMGLVLAGAIQHRFFMREWKPGWKRYSVTLASSFLLGIGFSAGWSPCVGPILAGVIALAASDPTAWFKLITAYTLGFAAPFFCFAFYIGSVSGLSQYTGVMTKVGGFVMVIMGVLLFSGQLAQLTIWLQRITPNGLVF